MNNAGSESRTNGYQPNPHTTGPAFEAYLAQRDPAPSDLVDTVGKVTRTLPSSVPSRTKRGANSKWGRAHPANATKINLPALEAFRGVIEHTLQHSVLSTEDREKTQLRWTAASQIIHTCHNTVRDGYLPVQYEQSDAGRLYAVGLSLQNVPREVRAAAMTGQWDYDISNAHFAILDQLAEKSGYTCTAIRDYLVNKRRIREAVSMAARIDVDDAKGCLIATVYGAGLNPYYGEIAKEIGRPAAERLFSFEPFVAIATDARRASAAILEAAPRSRGRITNAMSLVVEISEDRKTIASHLLQGMEAVALNAIVSHHGEDISLCVHDGWCSESRLDLKEQERLIAEATGLNLKVEEERLGK